jgi:predicted CoA-substrate-specific enzyme activase
MTETKPYSAGIDVGTECVKAVIIDRQGTLIGSTVVPRRGYFQDRATEAFAAVLDDAQVETADLAGICATGFGDNCVPMATCVLGEAACHAIGAYHHYPHAMTVIDIGGRDPKAVHIDEQGRPQAIHTLRRCAAGIGTFLIFAARHLDVHPSRLQEMAAMADMAAEVGSYCSTFSGQDILERLRDGTPREEVALGCIHSIAERVVEIARFEGTVRVTGGVAEYFPGVLLAIAQRLDVQIAAVPQPILTGALGAALWVFDARRFPSGREGADR